jgi:hypothetical protein
MKKQQIIDIFYENRAWTGTFEDYLVKYIYGFLGRAVGKYPMGTTGRFIVCGYNSPRIMLFVPSGSVDYVYVPFNAVHVPSLDIYSENFEN